MKYILPVIVFFLLFFGSCKNKSTQNADEKQVAYTNEQGKLILPDIPAELTDPKERGTYLLIHYWDNFDFQDTAYLSLQDIMDPAFAGYIELLPYVDTAIAVNSIRFVLERAQLDKSLSMYGYFTDNLKKYLYDPNSPVRNEELYIPVAEYIVRDSLSSDAVKQKVLFDLELMYKNRVGYTANDFLYTLGSGKTSTLHKINAAYTLVMFYNPDCHTCAEILTYLKRSVIINRLYEAGGLKILTFYPDADLSIWQKHQRDIPAAWINGYDKNQVVLEKQIYDLKAIPTLYLLDKDKRVLLKDATAQTIEFYLKNHNQMLFPG